MSVLGAKLQPLLRQFLAGPAEPDVTDDRDSGRVRALPPGCRRVLLVLDRAVAADAAVEGFLARAQAASVDIVVLRVLPDWCLAELEAQTRATLERVASRLTSSPRRVAADVRVGEPVEQILRATEAHAADLIVLAVPRRGPGSEGDRSVVPILRRSAVPVLIMQSGDRLTTAGGARRK